jgi:hydrophobe/amphiphile efflux-3 (HAE3) family protein
VLGALALITMLAAAALPRLNFDNSIESWFLDTDPSLTVYDEFIDTFRADQIVVVGFFADDIFDDDVLRVIDRVSVESANLDFVERVQSITNSSIARRAGGFEDPGFQQLVLDSPLQRGSLLSPGSDATAVVIYYSRGGNTFRQKVEFVRGLRSILNDATAGVAVDYAVTGGPVLAEAAQTRNSGDMRTLIPAMILIIIVVAYGIFRRASLTLLPLVVVGIAVVWTFALMSLARWPMSMISIILVPLVLAVGVAHSIHIIAQYRVDLGRGSGHETSVRNSVVRLLKPCFFTSITTVIGLLSLLVSDLKPVHEFAITAAAGVFAAFVISVTFLPIMLLMMRPEDSHKASLAGGAVSRLLNRLHGFESAHTRRILLLALATGIAFFWLAHRVDSGLDPMSWIRHDDPLRIETERVDDAFGGALPLEFLLSSAEGQLSDPANLRRMDEFQDWLVANTTVRLTTSVSDLVKEAARIARDEGIDGFALPRSRIVTDGLLAALGRAGELEPWVTPDYSRARIVARIPLSSAQEIVNEIPLIRQRIAEDFADSGVTVELTGHAILAGTMQTHMIDSQLNSFGVALAVVSLVMIVLLRSVVLGLLAMVPNLLPIIIGLGSMALLDIALNPATVMIAAVALGIVVDDTVHLMTAFEREMRRTGKIAEAIRSTLLHVGRPVVVTTVLLAAGFSMLILGNFLPVRQLGGLIALIAVAALVTDLVFLPAMMRLLPERSVRKFLGVATSRSDG